MNKEISIIIPFLNEQENIPSLTSALDTFFRTNNLSNCEVIFVDDGSTDDSVAVFREHLRGKSFSSRIVKLSRNFGSHAAVRAGLQHARGQYAMFLPADLQDPPELILKLHAKSKEGFDIVFGSRQNTATGFMARRFTRSYAAMMRKYVH